MSLDQICAVIDFDGFVVAGRFLVRELGYTSLKTGRSESYRFQLDRYKKSLTEKDWRTVRYCKEHVHGLSFSRLPWERETFPLENLGDLLRNFYSESKTRERYLMAYKGGHVERDVLEELGIPCANLEDFGCPKYDLLPRPEIRDCGFHRRKTDHCPKKETRAFADWVREHEED